MKKQHLIVLYSITGLILIFLLLLPYLDRRFAAKIVKHVCVSWQTFDSAGAYMQWEDPEKSPPVNQLIDYKILATSLKKPSTGKFVEVTAFLEFSPNDTLPSGKEWIFIVTKTRYGWKITEFYPKK